jgi:type II secretory pathway pseudopilin PulG
MQRKTAPALTIVEIIVAVTIASILIILSIPIFKGAYASFRFENSANKIVSLMRYAQEIAVTEQEPYKMELYPQENKFQLVLDEKTQKMRELVVPRDYEVDTDILILVFNPVGGIEILNREMDPLKGTLSVGSIKLKDRKGHAAEIELWSYSGNITFKP